MANKFHREIGFQDAHIAHSYEYADASARTGASGFVADDIGRIARQLDDDTFWILTATTPTWAQLSFTPSLDVKVGIDAAATPDFIGALASDGVLRTDSTIDYVDGGDFVTLSVNEGNLSLDSTNISDFNEAAQDAVGGILTDTASIDFTYNDVANTIEAAVLPAGVDHDALSNFVVNEHIDHTAVTFTAGDGLSGGGDISANRTFNVDINSEADTVITASDEILFADADDSFNIKKDTVQGILDLVAAAGSEFADDVFRIQDNADATKELAFEVSNITTATTRTIAVQDEAMTVLSTTNHDTLTDGSVADSLHKHFAEYQFAFELEQANSKSGVYEVLAHFIFLGTGNIPAVDNRTMKIVGYVDGADGDFRIYDATNLAVVAEITGVTDITPTVHDMGTISNLPAGEVIFEIQALNTDNNKKKTFIDTFGIFINE